MARWRGLALIVCCQTLLFATAHARFVIEQGGLQIRLPAEAKKAHPNGFDMSLANFGAPKYGGDLLGQLIYLDQAHGENVVCSPTPCTYACQSFQEATPKFDLTKEVSKNYIMLVDRGPYEDGLPPCKFAEKVWYAQEAGAKGVIVVNYEDKHTTMEAPDDEEESQKYLKNITIPAAFITKSDGDVLKQLLLTKDGVKSEVLILLDWKDALPKAEKVTWEFWTNSNDMCGAVCNVQQEFIKEFVPMARELEQNNFTSFTPHYITWICPEPYRDSDECQSQCIHNGRYCTPDPDGDLEQGYEGRDIVQENVRQLCVFELANASSQSWLWWEYVTRFADECKMANNNYNEACAEQVFNEIQGNVWSSVDALRNCIGDMNADAPNPRLEAEMLSQRGDANTGEVYILPTIRINGGQYRGKLAYAEVLRAICASYSDGTEKPPPCGKVADDSCRPGSPGVEDCKARTDGKTQCANTFSGYDCICGPGFLQHTEKDGSVTCLNINECLSSSITSLDPNCTCERCVCHDTWGGYECEANVPDACAVNFGGCWNREYTVNGQAQVFDACQDNLEAYRTQAGKGLNVTSFPLSECVCPPCFTEFSTGTCVPKCDLNFCDANTGVCSPESSTRAAGMAGWAVVVTVFACLGLVSAIGYAAYRLRLRSAMHNEIRQIMAQYMPLENQEGAEGAAAQGKPSARGGASNGHEDDDLGGV